MQKTKKKEYPSLEKARKVLAKKRKEGTVSITRRAPYTMPPGTYKAKIDSVEVTGKKRKPVVKMDMSLVDMDFDKIEKRVAASLVAPTKMGSRKRRPNLEEVAKAIDVLQRAGLI